jgi:hypothetical protein
MAKKIQITAKTDGFRRAGIAHSASPQLYDTDRFTSEELKLLKAEEQLVVVEVDVPDEKKNGKDDDEKLTGKDADEKKPGKGK